LRHRHLAREELGQHQRANEENCRAKQPDEREASISASDDLPHQDHGKHNYQQETHAGQQTAHCTDKQAAIALELDPGNPFNFVKIRIKGHNLREVQHLHQHGMIGVSKRQVLLHI
jgi:hypothetical protein